MAITIKDEKHARELAKKAHTLKAKHDEKDREEFETIKTTLLSQGYGKLVREYGIESGTRLL